MIRRIGSPRIRSKKKSTRWAPSKSSTNSCGRRRARKPTPPTSPTARTTSSASTICATISNTIRRNCASARFNYAIVDEIDSILIDEARTPLIISAPAAESENLYADIRRYWLPEFKADEDYTVDEKHRTVSLTACRHRKSREEARHRQYLYRQRHQIRPPPRDRGHAQRRSINRTKSTWSRTTQIVIVDEFTGRLQPGRRWSRGPASGHRGKGGRGGPAGIAHVRLDHFPKLFPPLQKTRRHDRNRRRLRPRNSTKSTASTSSFCRRTGRSRASTTTTSFSRPKTASSRPSRARSRSYT